MTFKYTSSEFTNILEKNISNGLLTGVLYYLKNLVLTEPIIAIPGLVSIIFWKKIPSILKPIFIYCVIYFFVIALTFYQSIRYLLPILILLPLFGAYTIYCIVHILKTSLLKRLVIISILSMAVIPSVIWVNV